MDESPGRFPPPPSEPTPPGFSPYNRHGSSYGPPRPYPLNLSRLLELTLSIFRFRWQTFVGIALLLMVPAWVVLSVTNVLLFADADWYTAMTNMFRTGQFENPLGRLLPAMIANLPISVIVGVATYVTGAALTNAAAQTYSSEPTSLADSFRAAAGRLRVLLGVVLVSLVITNVLLMGGVLLGLTLFLSTASGGQLQPGLMVFIGLIVLVGAFVALVFVAIRFALSVPVAMLEPVGAIDALRRSWRLVSGSGWRVLGYLFVFGLLIAVTGGLIGAIVTVVINPFHATSLTTFTVDPVKLTISTFVNGLISSALEPIPVIGTLLLYYDLRWRHGETVPQPGSRAPAPPMVPSPPR